MNVPITINDTSYGCEKAYNTLHIKNQMGGDDKVHCYGTGYKLK